MRSDTLKRVDRFIKTANEREARQIRYWSEHRLMTLGVIPPKQESKKTDRLFSRLAVESVPILLTLFVFIPLVVWGVSWVMWNDYFQAITQECPPNCEPSALVLWSVITAIGFMIIILAYYSARRLMLRARK
jgi:hypothetical protein